MLSKMGAKPMALIGVEDGEALEERTGAGFAERQSMRA